MSEVREGLVEIPRIEPDVLKSIIKFFYGHRITLDQENIYDYLDAAEYLQVEG